MPLLDDNSAGARLIARGIGWAAYGRGPGFEGRAGRYLCPDGSVQHGTPLTGIAGSALRAWLRG